MEDDLDLSDHKVTSEVHVFSEGDSHGEDESIVISKFNFTLPNKLLPNTRDVSQDPSNSIDDDGDLVVQRKDYTPDYSLSIKHHINTSLDLVGLQVWRGAFLLADYLLHSATDEGTDLMISRDDIVIELGAGTGLTSIVAGMVSDQVVSTDISKGNILALIDTNVKLNSQWIKGKVEAMELDFYNSSYPETLETHLKNSKLLIAADVVYHDDLTDAFLATLKRLMSMGRPKTALIALEKRFVFTLSDLDVGAPCYEYFHENLFRELSSFEIVQVDTSRIPQYFCYERVKELVFLKIQNRGSL
nr:EOG090X0C5G [Ceriodaphnia reticulata]